MKSFGKCALSSDRQCEHSTVEGGSEGTGALNTFACFVQLVLPEREICFGDEECIEPELQDFLIE